MPQAGQLSNSLVSTVTFLKEDNICIIWPHLIINMEMISIKSVKEQNMRKLRSSVMSRVVLSCVCSILIQNAQ